METQALVVRAEQELKESREISTTAMSEQKAAEKKRADANSQVKQLNEQVENAAVQRKTLSEKHTSLVGKHKACEKSLEKWQEELNFAQNARRESE